MKFLKHGPEIIVGTPGRVIDLLDRNIIHFGNIGFVVLDEVDRMLDIGFRDDIRNILSRIKGIRKQEGSPQEAGGHQTMFVSATIAGEIERLGRQYMREPIEKLIAPGADDKPTVEKVEQYYFSVQPWDKYRLLLMLLKRENPDLAIVFCRTKRGAEKLAKKLHADGIECREIHGNLAQNARERVMKSFRTGKFDVLIATDLASRGIDVADISHIINYDISEDPGGVHPPPRRPHRPHGRGRQGVHVCLVRSGRRTDQSRIADQHGHPAGDAGRPSGGKANTGGLDGGIRRGTCHRQPSKPIVSRFDRPYGSTTQPAAQVEGCARSTADRPAAADDWQQNPHQPQAYAAVILRGPHNLGDEQPNLEYESRVNSVEGTKPKRFSLLWYLPPVVLGLAGRIRRSSPSQPPDGRLVIRTALSFKRRTVFCSPSRTSQSSWRSVLSGRLCDCTDLLNEKVGAFHSRRDLEFLTFNVRSFEALNIGDSERNGPTPAINPPRHM